jgi:ubiquinone biosynthesis protein UbiJ
MSATPAWLALAEASLNRRIGESLQAGVRAHRLDGTALQVDILGLTTLRAAMWDGRLMLDLGNKTTADATATISGSPLALLQMLRGGASGRSASPNAPQIRGDAEVANLYRELFSQVRPDLEEELSRAIGDLPARRLSQVAKHALSWARTTRRTAGENLAEYLQEESRDLVNRAELDEFLRGVDVLRETADRVEARLARLEQRLERST